MTDEEIKKIAREYAESKCSIQEFLRAYDRRDNLNEAYCKEALMVLEWLSKDYCIVPKSKLKDEYTEASNTYWQKYSEESQMDSRHDVYERGYNVGIMNVMEDIFGKDMFEDIPNPD